MRVLVIGSGGREHALVWKLAQSSKVEQVFAAPGNAGMAASATCVPIHVDQTEELLAFAKENNIDLTVVGPEAPLVAGLTDRFEAAGLKVFGPSKAAAQLEGSKAFSKRIMDAAGVPTAKFETFTEAEPALAYVREQGAPIVVKADGLAAGKGVIVATTLEEAEAAVTQIMQDRAFGDAGAQVVIEEFLDGEEVSILGIVDGVNSVIMVPSQDHKRAYDGDEGPNTGGMGAYSPVPIAGDDFVHQVKTMVFDPMVAQMAQEGAPFKGVLYAGLMVTSSGIKVLEFNVRFGDPECQVVLPRLKTDLFDVMLASADGGLDSVTLEWDARAAATVVLASQGYPGSYPKGKVMTGLDCFDGRDDAVLFHAGTSLADDQVVTAGGRVLNVVGLGATLEQALQVAYEGVAAVDFEGKQFRTDIGHRAVHKTGA